MPRRSRAGHHRADKIVGDLVPGTARQLNHQTGIVDKTVDAPIGLHGRLCHVGRRILLGFIGFQRDRLPPADWSSSAILIASSPLRSAITTRAPACARCCEYTSPMSRAQAALARAANSLTTLIAHDNPRRQLEDTSGRPALPPGVCLPWRTQTWGVPL